jgi:hypothetical protein
MIRQVYPSAVRHSSGLVQGLVHMLNVALPMPPLELRLVQPPLVPQPGPPSSPQAAEQ